MNDSERFVIQQIERIQRDYQEQIQPWVNRLVHIRSLEPLPPLFIDASQLPGVDIDAIHRRLA